MGVAVGRVVVWVEEERMKGNTEVAVKTYPATVICMLQIK